MSDKDINRAENLLRSFVACFEAFNGSLGNSLQGWDYPKLHRVRDRAIKFLAEQSSVKAAPQEPRK